MIPLGAHSPNCGHFRATGGRRQTTAQEVRIGAALGPGRLKTVEAVKARRICFEKRVIDCLRDDPRAERPALTSSSTEADENHCLIRQAAAIARHCSSCWTSPSGRRPAVRGPGGAPGDGGPTPAAGGFEAHERRRPGAALWGLAMGVASERANPSW